MNDKEIPFLRTVFASIVKGYSPASYRGCEVFIRHLSVHEQSLIDTVYLEAHKHAIDKGLIDEAKRLDILQLSGEWVESDEQFLESQKLYIKGLFDTKKNLAYHSQFEQVNNQIADAQKAYTEKAKQKFQLLGMTAESYAKRKLNQSYAFHSFYKDKALTIPLFSEEEFKDLIYEESEELINLYYNALANLSTQNIKLIAIASFFQTSFYLCDDNIHQFFGKPIVELTFYQTELASYGKYFKHLFANAEMTPPEEIKSDPDKLMDWFTGQKNVEKSMANNEGKQVAVVGATQKDLELAGLKSENLLQKTTESLGKKSLSLNELVKMGQV